MRPVLIALLAWAAPASLQAEPGLTGASTLQRPLSARPVGLAEAFSAVDGGLDSLGYNPAGLTRLAKPELASSYMRGIASDDFGFIGYAHPLPGATVTGGLSYYNSGSINLNLSDGTQATVTAEQDMVGLAGVSIPLGGGLCVGALAKLYRLQLAQQAQATGFAGDVGALWHSPFKGLNLGASLQNLGPDVKFEQTADPLPLTIRFGAAYDFSLAQYRYFQENGYGFSSFLITADGVKPRDQNQVLPAVGLEMRMLLGEGGAGALRFGYMLLRDAASLSFGIGIREGRWFFDYGLGVNRNDIADTHQFTVGLNF